MLNYSPKSEQDYYTLLGISSEASPAEIKRAYRKRLKDLHPDLNPDSGTQDVDALVRAYRVLRDPQMREDYDRFQPKRSGFSFREFLKEQGDPRSIARLILHDLLNGFEEEACSIYLEHKEHGFVLSNEFDREDYMDCAFILSEELLARGNYIDSMPLLIDLLRLEKKQAWFRHFFPEVLSFLAKSLVQAQHSIDIQTLLAWTEECLGQNLPEKDAVVFLKLAAMWYIRCNELERARFYMQECERVQKSRAGLAELDRAIKKAQYKLRS
jgi:curved DNA-binding protein CbpA